MAAGMEVSVWEQARGREKGSAKRRAGGRQAGKRRGGQWREQENRWAGDFY